MSENILNVNGLRLGGVIKSDIRNNNGYLEYRNSNTDIWEKVSQIHSVELKAELLREDERILYYVRENLTLYCFIQSGSGYIVDNDKVIQGSQPDYRYIGISGQYSYFSTGGSGNTTFIERYIIDAALLSSKSITLLHTPSGNQSIVFIENGTTCSDSIDYSIIANTLSWNGLSLDGLLDIGDVIKILYVY